MPTLPVNTLNYLHCESRIQNNIMAAAIRQSDGIRPFWHWQGESPKVQMENFGIHAAMLGVFRRSLWRLGWHEMLSPQNAPQEIQHTDSHVHADANRRILLFLQQTLIGKQRIYLLKHIHIPESALGFCPAFQYAALLKPRFFHHLQARDIAFHYFAV